MAVEEKVLRCEWVGSFLFHLWSVSYISPFLVLCVNSHKAPANKSLEESKPMKYKPGIRPIEKGMTRCV